MINVMKVLSLIIFLGISGVTVWASTRIALWTALPAFLNDPWSVATLCDAYAGFVFFSAWVLWREATGAGRFAWVLAIILLGNITTSFYVLLNLYRLKPGEGMMKLMLGQHAHRLVEKQ